MPNDSPIPHEEMIALFGEVAPPEAYQVIADAPKHWTMADIRQELRKVAEKRNAERKTPQGKLPELDRYSWMPGTYEDQSSKKVGTLRILIPRLLESPAAYLHVQGEPPRPVLLCLQTRVA